MYFFFLKFCVLFILLFFDIHIVNTEEQNVYLCVNDGFNGIEDCDIKLISLDISKINKLVIFHYFEIYVIPYLLE